jgi:hypothetical protein
MELREINDSLESLHKRVDRFYAWASQLQVEFRDIKQRIGFLETELPSSGFVVAGMMADPVLVTENEKNNPLDDCI